MMMKQYPIYSTIVNKMMTSLLFGLL